VNVYWLLIGALAVWRATHLLAAEDGPWQLLARLRRWAGERLAGQLLECFYCLSLWIAAPVACLIGVGWTERALLWLALSGAAILAERVTDPAPPAAYREDPEDDDAMLRKESAGGAGPGE
jgi:hypothetical protein